jgi:4-hydroxy-3-polyprenylbenzoate decarboxylase
MGYRNLAACVADLERHKQLVRIDAEVDPHLELAEIQRRLYQAGAPAVLFTRVRGTRFPMLANLFGTIERTRFLFRDAIGGVRKLVELKTDPGNLARRPWRYAGAPWTALKMLPRPALFSAPIKHHQTTLRELPQLQCWPNDGGAFVTLPLVYSEDPKRPGWAKSNLGMYRVQISGNDYVPDAEIGMHYQIHRGIGVHHAHAIERGEKLPVAVIIGGPPSLILSAVMPLPEGLPELTFAGALGGRAFRWTKIRSRVVPRFSFRVPAEADFVILGWIDPAKTKPEGPFGDHLGYYSLTHEFPSVEVEAVYHRPDAIWPFTVVGRPPQEDTSFGEIIHDITGPVIPTVLPGVRAVHAVDAAGVHPLLLAIGSERYVPYAAKRKPQELLTAANAILGQGQLSLAKYLLIVAGEDNPALDIHDIGTFFEHLLERIDLRVDLHFQTQTTIDTLDYTSGAFNAGSKVVWAAAGAKRRTLGRTLPTAWELPAEFHNPCLAMPGVICVQGPAYGPVTEFPDFPDSDAYPLIVLCDDAAFSARTLDNFLWTTFTRSNPATDIHGIGSFTQHKHWGCTGPMIIDARVKPFHAPPLLEDAKVSARVDQLTAPGGPLHGLI